MQSLKSCRKFIYENKGVSESPVLSLGTASASEPVLISFSCLAVEWHFPAIPNPEEMLSRYRIDLHPSGSSAVLKIIHGKVRNT